jgi:hypothetical protein
MSTDNTYLSAQQYNASWGISFPGETIFSDNVIGVLLHKVSVTHAPANNITPNSNKGSSKETNTVIQASKAAAQALRSSRINPADREVVFALLTTTANQWFSSKPKPKRVQTQAKLSKKVKSFWL